MPGRSGNPGGRSKTQVDIQALARQHGPAAISALAQALKSRNERVRVAAAGLLLDRGYGRAPVAVSVETHTPLGLLHLAAARALSAELAPGLCAPAAASAELQPSQPLTIEALAALLPPTE
jgi:hypothetical protein